MKKARRMKEKKMKNRMLKKIMVVGIIVIAMVSSNACSKKEFENTDAPIVTESEQVTLNVWSTADEVGRFVEGFESENPDIKVEVQVLANSDYLAKLIPTLSSGQNAPDLFTAESDYVKKLVETDLMADLEAEPYKFDNSEAGLWDYVVDVGTDMSGIVKALSWQASPGGILYRTDLAETHLGITTPEEMSAMLKTNEDMLAVAMILQENGVKMFASWEDLLNMEFSNREEAWVVDNELKIDANLLTFMDTAKTIAQNGYALNASPWDGEWIAAVNTDEVFGYVLPTWGYQFVVKANADVTIGSWGLAETSNPYIKGGTWLGIYAKTEKQDAAYKFLEYVTMNEESQTAYAKETGEYMSIIAVDEALAKGPGDEVLGGQNQYEFYNNEMKKNINDFITEYDGILNTSFLSATKLYVDGTLTKEEAIEQFQTDAQTAFPDLDVK